MIDEYFNSGDMQEASTTLQVPRTFSHLMFMAALVGEGEAAQRRGERRAAVQMMPADTNHAMCMRSIPARRTVTMHPPLPCWCDALL